MAPPPKSSYELIIADKSFPIDWPTYTFRDENPGFNGHLTTCTSHSHGRCGANGGPYAPAKGMSGNIHRVRPRRISERSVAAAQAVIKQFVVHLDGCLDAEMTFNVLHNERGLSCHFILDNDGVLYQTVDLADCAYHAAGLNESSIGIEMCNRGDAKKEPDFYARHPNLPPRDTVTCTINGNLYVAFDFTPQQYLAMQALGKALAKYLPGIKLDYPQSSPGSQHWGTLYPTDLTGAHLRATYTGYLGHYHITERKWDPGPFDFKSFLGKLGGKRSFPMALKPNVKPEVPAAPKPGESREGYEDAFEPYYDNTELVGAGGFYPVGPLDDAQLYHGGVHLHADRGTPIIAPLPGKVVAARNGPITSTIEIGSVSFVLLHHNVKVSTEELDFYTIYFHLEDETAGQKKTGPLKWMGGEGWDDAEPGKLIILDPPEPVQAGDVIGHVGVAGPDAEPQVHWEVFAVDHGPVERLDKLGFWQYYSGAGDTRYCTNKEILAKVERKKDGIITEDELMEAFRGDPTDRLWARTAVTNHYSEWSLEPDWIQSLQNAPANKKKPKRQREIQEMYEKQILPTLWWTDAVAQRIGLPAEARIFNYHPVSFLRWLNDLTGVRQDEVSRKATKEDFDKATSKAKLDIDDTEGTSFVSEADLVVLKPQDQLQLPDMVDGYGD